MKHDPNNAELQKNIKEIEAKQPGSGAPGGAGAGADTNAMMQMYMKLLNHPETKDIMSDPTFLPILQSVMSNPQEMFKHMGDPRVQKVMKVLQESVSPQQAQQAAEKFMNKDGGMPNFGGSESEPMKEENFSAPPPKKEKPAKSEKMDIEDPAEKAKAKGNEQFKKKNFNEALNYYEEAIQVNPNEPLYYNNKAAAFIEQAEYESAFEELAKAEKLFSEGVVKDFVKKAKILARKGNIYMRQGMLDEAIYEYDKSLMEDTNPKVKDDLNKCKKMKKEKEAKEYINPELAEKHNEQGSALYK